MSDEQQEPERERARQALAKHREKWRKEFAPLLEFDLFASEAERGEQVRGPSPDAQRAELPSEQSSMEQHMQRVIQAVGDGNAARIMAIANRADLSGEQKMTEIIRLDCRFKGKNSVAWATLLGVSPPAVRGYDCWKELQKEKKADR